jgi:hypothetical protein
MLEEVMYLHFICSYYHRLPARMIFTRHNSPKLKSSVRGGVPACAPIESLPTSLHALHSLLWAHGSHVWVGSCSVSPRVNA